MKKSNLDMEDREEEMEDEYVSALEEEVSETQEDVPKKKKGWAKSLISPLFKKSKPSDIDLETEDIESEFISNFENSEIPETLEDAPPERKSRKKSRTATSTRKTASKGPNPDIEEDVDVEEEIENKYVSNLDNDEEYETQKDAPKKKKGWAKSLISPLFKKSKSSDTKLEMEETEDIESEFISDFENSVIPETLEDTPPEIKDREKSSTATSTRKPISKKSKRNMETEFIPDSEEDAQITEAQVTKEDFSELRNIVKDLGMKIVELTEAQKSKDNEKTTTTPLEKKPAPKKSEIETETEDTETEDIETETTSGPDNTDVNGPLEDTQIRETQVTKEEFAELKNIVRDIGTKVGAFTTGPGKRKGGEEPPATHLHRKATPKKIYPDMELISAPDDTDVYETLEDARIRKDYVTKEDFSVLRDIVRDIGTKIGTVTTSPGKSRGKYSATHLHRKSGPKKLYPDMELISGPDDTDVYETLEDPQIREAYVTKDEYSELMNIVRGIGVKIGAFTMSPEKSPGEYSATHLHKKSTSKKPNLHMENEFISDSDDTDLYETLEDTRIREAYVTKGEFSELMNIVRDIGIKVGVLVVAPRER